MSESSSVFPSTTCLSFPLAAHAVYRGFSKHHRPFVDLICPLNCRKFITSAESAQGGFEKKLKKIFQPVGRAFCRAFCRGGEAEGEASGGPVVRAQGRARQNRLRARRRARPRAGQWLGRPQGISLEGGRTKMAALYGRNELRPSRARRRAANALAFS